MGKSSVDPEVVRFFILRAHYRSPLNYSDAHLDDAKVALTRLYMALKEVAPDAESLDWDETYALRFVDAMRDDFNTPVAISVLFDLANEINKNKSAVLARQLKGLAAVIGLLQRNADDFLKGRAVTGDLSEGVGIVSSAEVDIQSMINARTMAKVAKNFVESDRIRADLLAKGIVLEDKAGGITEWRRI